MNRLIMGLSIVLIANCCIGQDIKNISSASVTNNVSEISCTNVVVREWTNINGVKIKAEFVSRNNGIVILKMRTNNTDINMTIKESALCKKDQLFLKDIPNTVIVKKKVEVKEKKIVEKPKKYPAEAAEFKGHHYMVYSDTTTWDRAKFKCTTRGGHLVVINDMEENTFVYELIKDSHRATWIGLSKSIETWRWSTSEGSEYRNWSPGEPNIGAGKISPKIGVGINVCMYGEYCTSQGTFRDYHNISQQSKWDDRFGDDTGVTGYVCEWDE